MSSPSDNSQRKIIPRWRDFNSTTRLGELKSASGSIPRLFLSPLSKHPTYSDWKEEPSLWNALDLIGSAIVSNEVPAAGEALQQVRNDPSTPELAKSLLSEIDSQFGKSDPSEAVTGKECPEIYGEIRRAKHRLAEFPWDAIEWVELARGYTTLGIRRKAERSIRAALQIAPQNRYVLRSAARFYVHIGELDRAQLLLFRAANTKYDPWLLASEIAISSAMNRTSHLTKVGQAILREDLSPDSLTELASALGTLEADSGNERGARRLLRQAVQGANENSVAQVEWLNRHRLGEAVDTSSANPPLLNEANAWTAFLKGEWEESLSYSMGWLRDQPFSSHPALLATYLLSDIMQTYDRAKEIGQLAIRANPNEPMLLNNYAFALINLGKLTEARDVLRQIDFDSLEGINRLIPATVGLLEFRTGNQQGGRQRYLNTIEEAKSTNHKRTAARAAIYLAMEELRARTDQAEIAIKRALDLSKGIDNYEVKWQLGQLNSSAQEYLANRPTR